MKHIIIGLGNFGRALVEELASARYEVVGIDYDPAKVDAIKDITPSVYQLDATDKSALSIVSINKDDVVVVALGKDFGMSVRVTALLKSMKVNNIFVRVIDNLHEAVLQSIGITNILNPELDSSRLFAQSASFIGRAELMKIDQKHSVIKISLPSTLDGTKLKDIGLDKYSLKPLLISRTLETKNILGITVTTEKADDNIDLQTVINKDDKIVIYGDNDDIRAYWKAIH